MYSWSLPVLENIIIETLASQRTVSSLAFLKSPFLRLEYVTWRLVVFSILLIWIFPRAMNWSPYWCSYLALLVILDASSFPFSLSLSLSEAGIRIGSIRNKGKRVYKGKGERFIAENGRLFAKLAKVFAEFVISVFTVFLVWSSTPFHVGVWGPLLSVLLRHGTLFHYRLPVTKLRFIFDTAVRASSPCIHLTASCSPFLDCFWGIE